jgi:hypothetical protein
MGTTLQERYMRRPNLAIDAKVKRHALEELAVWCFDID